MKQRDYVYGRRAVLEVIRSSPDRINKLFIAEGAHGRTIDEIRELARQKRLVTKILPKRALDRHVAGAAHQGVAASVSPVRYANIDDLTEAYYGEKPALLLLLDGITDPQNFGAILRTADAVGADGVIIPRHRSVSLSATVAKHSAGASEYVPVARTPNIAGILDKLADIGFQVVGTACNASATIYEIDLTRPTAIVIGSEGGGIRPIVRKKCDFVASIPMYGKVSSLNASVAAAVVLYEALRQRGHLSAEAP